MCLCVLPVQSVDPCIHNIHWHGNDLHLGKPCERREMNEFVVLSAQWESNKSTNNTTHLNWAARKPNQKENYEWAWVAKEQKASDVQIWCVQRGTEGCAVCQCNKEPLHDLV